MKKRILISAVSSLFLFQNCKKENEKNWDIEVKTPTEKVVITDISKELYDTEVTLEQFKAKYPWFQGTVSDEDFVKRRADEKEIKLYKDAIAKIDISKLQSDLQDLFSHIKHYFPSFKTPSVYLFSSVLQMAEEPVFIRSEENMVFIDITGFMGAGNEAYKGVIETYFQKSMNPQNIVPKVSEIIAQKAVLMDINHQKFIDQIVYNGKIMILQDAFLPKTPDYLKINYDQKQYDWAKANEGNIWNYFVENNSVFSDDPRLIDRFILPAPFSKFYTEIDNESSPQIGIFTGWQICKKFFQEKPDTKLEDFLRKDAQTIFNEANYKPKVTE